MQAVLTHTHLDERVAAEMQIRVARLGRLICGELLAPGADPSDASHLGEQAMPATWPRPSMS